MEETARPSRAGLGRTASVSPWQLRVGRGALLAFPSEASPALLVPGSTVSPVLPQAQYERWAESWGTQQPARGASTTSRKQSQFQPPGALNPKFQVLPYTSSGESQRVARQGDCWRAVQPPFLVKDSLALPLPPGPLFWEPWHSWGRPAVVTFLCCCGSLTLVEH